MKNNPLNRKEVSMKRFITALFIVALFLGFTVAGMAQTNDNHTVSVAVSAVDEIDISDAAVTLTINSATAGSDLDAATDNTSTLSWTTNNASRKITVALSAAYSTGITLEVQAGAPSGGGTAMGTPAGSYTEVTTSDADLITGIDKAYATSSITYRASASVTAGVITSESRTVTYTLTAGS